MVIRDYFIDDISRLKNRHLFAKLDRDTMKNVDLLEQHLAFGDYQFLHTFSDPSIVGCFFKSILKYMDEPLCTFEKYPMFKVICECITGGQQDGIMRSITEIFLLYDPVHRETWRFVLWLLYHISEANDKLSAKTIATIFSDILFKPKEYKTNDMLIWKQFTELLTLMISNQERIFAEIDETMRRLKEEKFMQ